MGGGVANRRAPNNHRVKAARAIVAPPMGVKLRWAPWARSSLQASVIKSKHTWYPANVWENVPDGRRRIMRAIRSRDTRPEMALRRALHQVGYRYRLHLKELPGAPDLVFPRRRKVIFVHGCFWHFHRCAGSKIPETRRDYWEPKLRATRTRDRRNKRKLERLGWDVLVVWECELMRALPPVRRFLGAPRGPRASEAPKAKR